VGDGSQIQQSLCVSNTVSHGDVCKISQAVVKEQDVSGDVGSRAAGDWEAVLV